MEHLQLTPSAKDKARSDLDSAASVIEQVPESKYLEDRVEVSKVPPELLRKNPLRP
jgi:hypothetical protein